MNKVVITVFLIAISCKSLLGYENMTTWEETIRLKRQSADGPCILPEYPEYGQYTVRGKPDAQPGDTMDVAQLNISCHPGLRPQGDSIVYCIFGSWSSDVPQCVRFCKLDVHPSVRYRCSGSTDEGYRVCKEYEPTGTMVKPQCTSNYYYTGVKSLMRCTNGRWDHIVICTPDCGQITPEGKPLLTGGREVLRGEFPWHAGIYLKPQTQGAQYRLICGGSIISTKVIISAAHCFWYRDKVRPPSAIAVAVGKLYQMFNSPEDDDAQKFDVAEIKIPVRYQDIRTKYQDDIAAVTLSAEIVYQPHVRPVCVDLDPVFDHIQLQEGNMGKVAGWGYADKDGTPSPVLKVLDMPYVKVERCILESPDNFKAYITSDKICAGYQNGSAVCRGDSGGGLVFPALDRGKKRYFLRGIVSTAAQSEDECNVYSRASFTQIVQHSGFIEENTVLYDLTLPFLQESNPACVLPAFPRNGQYLVVGTPGAAPGQVYQSAQLEIRCNPGFVPDTQDSPSCSYGRWSGNIPNCVRFCKIPGDSTASYRCYKESNKEEWDCNEIEPSGVKVKVICGNNLHSVASKNDVECAGGVWSGKLTCERFCKLDPHPSVEYTCVVNAEGIVGSRACGAQEPSNTIVTPQCQAPIYYSPGVLNKMRCIDGRWDYIAICNPECGRSVPTGVRLRKRDITYAERGAMPWHAGVYTKTTSPYMQICGGTLISTTVVISAAHCFWSDLKKQLPAKDYAVALGKYYRPWNDPRDTEAQKSDISDIKIPPRFQGALSNFQEDIAILTLADAIEYKTYVRPVCLDFNLNFDHQQLQAGKTGKMVGWGLTGEDGPASPILKALDLPYVEIDKCIGQLPIHFTEYITSDKICAGRKGTALCKGDSGGGLVFPEQERGVERYYLRGIASAAPINDHACNLDTIGAFTQITKHEAFIKKHLKL